MAVVTRAGLLLGRQESFVSGHLTVVIFNCLFLDLGAVINPQENDN